MKRIFTLFCMMLLALQFVAAQNTLYIVSSDGKLTDYSVQKMAFDNDVFSFTHDISDVRITYNSFSGSFSVAFKSEDYKSFSSSPEVGICFSDVNENPTIADGKIKKGNTLSKYTFEICGLDTGATYYYRAYVKVNDAVYYGGVYSVKIYGEDNYIYKNGHRFVDLGLPSGLLWATYNVGAAAAADDGNYYAWGETEPQSSDRYTWSSYKYGTSMYDLTKYNASDEKTTLEPSDDAAYVNWGASCRMPTRDEIYELFDTDYCTWEWTTMTTSDGSSIYGYKVTSVKNGKSIFFPASGYCADEGLARHGSFGYYWSSSVGIDGSNTSMARHLYLYELDYIGNRDYRYNGFPVRPVANR